MLEQVLGLLVQVKKKKTSHTVVYLRLCGNSLEKKLIRLEKSGVPILLSTACALFYKMLFVVVLQVFLIVALQLLVTTSIVAVFTFVPSVHLFIIRNPVAYWMSVLIFLIIYELSVIDVMRRRFPGNLILLFIFTLAMSFMAGTTSSYFETETVFLLMVMMVVVCVAITVFSFQTKVEFTSRPGLFCVLCIVLLITGIITAIVLYLQYIKWLSMLYTALGVVFFTLFLLYNTWLLLEKRIYELKPEEYLFGALTLYTITPTFWFLMRDTDCLSV